MLRRIVAIAFILVCTSIAWAILGGTIFSRTYSTNPGLRARVESSWGSPQKQRPPAVTYSYRVAVKSQADDNGKNAGQAPDQVITGTLPLDSSHVDVNLHLDHRQKGLLWYNTYSADFSGAYVFRNDTDQARPVTLSWPFPAEKAVYDDLSFALDGKPLEFKNDNSQATAAVLFAAGETHALTVSYRSQGLDSWQYDFGSGVSQVRDFRLRMTTNFRDVDFAENSVSPTEKSATPGGWELTWRYRNLVSGYALAVLMPSKIQPGPLAGDISFFAPVSLFFFFFVMFIITTLRGVDLHPMNYFFLAAAFFAFHRCWPTWWTIFPSTLRSPSARWFDRSGGELSAPGGGDAFRSARRRNGAAHLPGAVFLCLLLQGIHGPGGDHRRHPDAVRRDADDRALQLERAIPENESAGDGVTTLSRSGLRR